MNRFFGPFLGAFFMLAFWHLKWLQKCDFKAFENDFFEEK